MAFSPKPKIRFSLWVVISFITLISLGVVLLFGRKISNTTYYFTLAATVFVMLATIISVLLYIMYCRLKDKVTEFKLQNKIKRLEYRLDKAKKESNKKSNYLTNISHEIRTPLSTILGMIHMLKSTDLDLDQQAQVEIAEYSSEHLLQLVNMILNNSKGVDVDLEIENAPINIEVDLTKLFKVFEYQAWEKGLDFEYRFVGDKKNDFLLLGDIAKIQQVLINLINNAIKFTNAGKIEVVIDNTDTDDDFQVVTFYVKDTGIGMKRLVKEEVFDNNSIGAQSLLSKLYNRGSGVGLSVSKKLVKLMGGELKFESKENQGSAFYFSLQLKKTLIIIEDEQARKPFLLNKFDYRFNVLVAEDNKMNQKVIKFLLEQNGATCTFVTNGLDAVNVYKAVNFDMIFMDIYMPKIDGYKATEMIKATDKYAKNNIPIIAVSASAFKEDIRKAKEAGVDDFIAKPIDNEKLKTVLRKYALNREEQVS